MLPYEDGVVTLRLVCVLLAVVLSVNALERHVDQLLS